MKTKKMKKIFKKIMISILSFIILIQPVNADESNIKKLSKKFNQFWQCINKEVEQTKDYQIKKWAEEKQQNAKKLKIVQHKLTGFFSGFPRLDKK